MHKKAFTLAEVLITIVIIGMVCSMTLPALINKINMKHYIAQLKEDYSILSQAHNALTAENGNFAYSIEHCAKESNQSTRNSCFRDTFATKFKSIRKCEEPYSTDKKTSCFPEFSKIKHLNGTPASTNYLNISSSTIVLANGSVLLFYLDSATCAFDYEGQFNYKRCGWITLDVNGLKKPNTFGKDIYILYVMDKAVKPLAYEFMAEFNRNGDCTPESNGYSCSSIYLIE